MPFHPDSPSMHKKSEHMESKTANGVSLLRYAPNKGGETVNSSEIGIGHDLGLAGRRFSRKSKNCSKTWRRRHLNRKAAIYTDAVMALHQGSTLHPESPRRLIAITERLLSYHSNLCVFKNAQPSSKRQITEVHSPSLFCAMLSLTGDEKLFQNAHCSQLPLEKTFSELVHGPSLNVPYCEIRDMFWNRFTNTAALCAAGHVSELASRVAGGDLATGFALVRPPGHHAGADKAEGFCWFNNVAIAAQLCLEESESSRASKEKSGRAIRKILIVDWDVHHGNGTQDIFLNSNKVLYFSLHRYGRGFYPSSGSESEAGVGEGRGFTVNVPWRRKRLGDAEYIAAFRTVLRPLFEEFKPDLTLVSAGFDAARGDKLGEMDVTPACFGWMAAELLDMSGGRNVAFALEGGYDKKTISDSALAVIDVLGRCGNGFSNGATTKGTISGARSSEDGQIAIHDFKTIRIEALETLTRVLTIQSSFWPRLERNRRLAEKIFAEREAELKGCFEQRSPPTKIIEGGYFAGLGAFSNYVRSFN